MTEKARRGARRKADLNEPTRAAIESGKINAATHVEQMAIRMSRLLAAVEPEIEFDATALDSMPFLARMRTAGSLLFAKYGPAAYADGPRAGYTDIPRGWQAFAIQSSGLPLDTAFGRAIPFADDGHFAVREWAWLAIRPWVVADPGAALEQALLAARTGSPNVRRFAVEATRPRSVWGSHVAGLKKAPELGEQLLDEVIFDYERYVTTAVVNWISDAARTRPDWARLFIDGLDRKQMDPWLARRLDRHSS